MLEQIETRGLLVVPVKPTSEMQQAIKQALDQGKRTKQRWRYQATIDVAPSWRRGYEQGQKAADGQPEA